MSRWPVQTPVPLSDSTWSSRHLTFYLQQDF